MKKIFKDSFTYVLAVAAGIGIIGVVWLIELAEYAPAIY